MTAVPAEKSGEGFSYQRWYEDNKSTFNKARRSRYHTDPGYRDKVLRWNRESRQKKRASEEQEHRAEVQARRVVLPTRRWKTETMMLRKGSTKVEERMFSIGALAEVLGRSIQVIRLWEREGVISKTPHRNAKGDRLYTAKQMQEILDHLTRAGRLEDQGGRQRQGLRPIPRKVRFSNGEIREAKLYKVGVLAKAIERTIITVEQMEERGALPATPFRGALKSTTGSKGYRLYTLGMIRIVEEAFVAQGRDIRGEDKRLAFHDHILLEWSKIGVVGAALQVEP